MNREESKEAAVSLLDRLRKASAEMLADRTAKIQKFLSEGNDHITEWYDVCMQLPRSTNGDRRIADAFAHTLFEELACLFMQEYPDQRKPGGPGLRYDESWKLKDEFKKQLGHFLNGYGPDGMSNWEPVA
jgi:hypothetical protein